MIWNISIKIFQNIESIKCDWVFLIVARYNLEFTCIICNLGPIIKGFILIYFSLLVALSVSVKFFNSSEWEEEYFLLTFAKIRMLQKYQRLIIFQVITRVCFCFTFFWKFPTPHSRRVHAKTSKSYLTRVPIARGLTSRFHTINRNGLITS